MDFDTQVRKLVSNFPDSGFHHFAFSESWFNSAEILSQKLASLQEGDVKQIKHKITFAVESIGGTTSPVGLHREKLDNLWSRVTNVSEIIVDAEGEVVSASNYAKNFAAHYGVDYFRNLHLVSSNLMSNVRAHRETAADVLSDEARSICCAYFYTLACFRLVDLILSVLDDPGQSVDFSYVFDEIDTAEVLLVDGDSVGKDALSDFRSRVSELESFKVAIPGDAVLSQPGYSRGIVIGGASLITAVIIFGFFLKQSAYDDFAKVPEFKPSSGLVLGSGNMLVATEGEETLQVEESHLQSNVDQEPSVSIGSDLVEKNDVFAEKDKGVGQVLLALDSIERFERNHKAQDLNRSKPVISDPEVDIRVNRQKQNSVEEGRVLSKEPGSSHRGSTIILIQSDKRKKFKDLGNLKQFYSQNKKEGIARKIENENETTVEHSSVVKEQEPEYQIAPFINILKRMPPSDMRNMKKFIERQRSEKEGKWNSERPGVSYAVKLQPARLDWRGAVCRKGSLEIKEITPSGTKQVGQQTISGCRKYDGDWQVTSFALKTPIYSYADLNSRMDHYDRRHLEQAFHQTQSGLLYGWSNMHTGCYYEIVFQKPQVGLGNRVSRAGIITARIAGRLYQQRISMDAQINHKLVARW